MTYPQAKPKWIRRNSMTLPKIGRLRMVKHREVKGRVKTVTVKRYGNGEWYAIIAVEMKGPEIKEQGTRWGPTAGLLISYTSPTARASKTRSS